MKTLFPLVMTASALVLALAPLASAYGMHHHRHHRMMVAYDPKDKRYYSVAYAKMHGMHDRGGDRLVIRSLSSLPPEARMSRAMHGRM